MKTITLPKKNIISVISHYEITIAPMTGDIIAEKLHLIDVLPAMQSDIRENLRKKLSEIIERAKVIEVDNICYTLRGVLYCSLLIDKNTLHGISSDLCIGLRRNPTYRTFHSSTPALGKDLLSKVGGEKRFHLRNISYSNPIEIYSGVDKERLALSRSLFIQNLDNRNVLNVEFGRFLNDSRNPEGAFAVRAPAGVGKSWWLCDRLSHIIEFSGDIFKIVYIDGSTGRLDRLVDSIDFAFCEQVSKFLTRPALLDWLVENEHSEKFDKENFRHMESRQLYLSDITSNYGIRREYYMKYFSHSELKLIVALDNIERFSDDEIKMIFLKLGERFEKHRNVYLVIPVRPSTLENSSRMSKQAMTIHHISDLNSPSLRETAYKRITVSEDGGERNIDKVSLGQGHTLKDVVDDIFDTVDNRVKRSVGSFLTNLCQYGDETNPRADVRYFIRLFRNLLSSKRVPSLKQYSDIYYATEALMTSGDGSPEDSKSFLINLFSDPFSGVAVSKPLSRFRTLEFIHIYSPNIVELRKFFRLMKYQKSLYRKILEQLIDTGLIVAPVSGEEEESRVQSFGPESLGAYRTDAPGRVHLSLVNNLWYMIMCKTNCRVYTDSAIFGTRAAQKAMEDGLGSVFQDHFKAVGWIPDDHFIKFLRNEEYLEVRRFSSIKNANDQEWVTKIYSKLQTPSQVISATFRRKKDEPIPNF